jgi:predicted RNase H-like nuclease (RuvC/YqgF family)
MENVNDSVNQPVENSVPTENQTTTNVQTPSAADDYKRDMFKYKQEARELKERLDAIEQDKQVKKGNYQEVITKLKSDLQSEKQSAQQLKVNFANARLDEAIKTKAIEKGIKGQNLDVFMKLIDDNSKSIVEFDEKFNVKSEDVSNLVDEHMSRYSDVFAKKVNVVDATPNTKVMNNPNNKGTQTKIITNNKGMFTWLTLFKLHRTLKTILS